MLSALQQDELRALTGDRTAVLRIVSALRKYRLAVNQVLSQVPFDGDAPRSVVQELEKEAQAIEEE